MSHTSMILTGLMLVALVIFLAPNIFAFNRGRILRNVALWLAIFLGLAAFYKSFGPGSPHPLFNLPEAMQGMHRAGPAVPLPAPAEKKPEQKNGSVAAPKTATPVTPPKK
ncbi:MAG: hypothetical protein KGI97_02940 [Alphaproteobacteria bacterium]|nr:hypothetical protein [Alphaproteobacteria bacterium]